MRFFPQGSKPQEAAKECWMIFSQWKCGIHILKICIIAKKASRSGKLWYTKLDNVERFVRYVNAIYLFF